MTITTDEVFFETCRSIGFIAETYNDPEFKKLYDQNPTYWNNLSKGMLLTIFCHLIESRFGDKETFKRNLATDDNKDILDKLFYIRNVFIHCQWDISKLDYENQKRKIRNLFTNGEYMHPGTPFEMTLSGDILNIKNIEPLCRVLLREAEA